VIKVISNSPTDLYVYFFGSLSSDQASGVSPSPKSQKYEVPPSVKLSNVISAFKIETNSGLAVNSARGFG